MSVAATVPLAHEGSPSGPRREISGPFAGDLKCIYLEKERSVYFLRCLRSPGQVQS
jgi:hypothetical protein